MSYLKNKKINTLLNKLYRNPYNFTETDIEQLIDLNVKPTDMKSLLYRLYKMNEGIILNKSGASEGPMGFFNKHCMNSKNNKFWKKISNIKKRNKIERVILAEGDSWFEFPLFIKEITDQLISRNKKNYAIYSLSYAGDWIANILYNREYIDKLSLIQPDIFLISGGGNDILGDYRLANLIIPRKELPAECNLNGGMGEKEFAEKCLGKSYYRLMRIMEFNYLFLFKSIKYRASHFKNLRIITQGYDYAKPDGRRGLNILFHFIKNGCWLKYPFMLKGYTDTKEMESIVKYMIDNLNEILIRTGEKFDNVYHIDVRGFVETEGGWHNEIHPKSKVFNKIAQVYEKCINKPLDDPPKERVFKCLKEEES